MCVQQVHKFLYAKAIHVGSIITIGPWCAACTQCLRHVLVIICTVLCGDVITYACPRYRSLYANAIHVGDTKHTAISLLYAHNAETRKPVAYWS